MASNINQTKDLILVHRNHNLLYKSYYHADCGGATESEFYVWNGGSRNTEVKDRSCPTSPKAKWRYTISKKRFLQALNLQEGHALKLSSFKKSPSGRHWEILISNGQQEQVVNTNELRKLLSE